MIVANFPYGRLGNQLDLAAHLITFCELSGKTISLQYLSERAEDFPYFDNSPMRVYPARRRLGPLFEKITARVLNKLIQYRLIDQIDFLQKNEWVYFDEPACLANPELVRLRKARFCTLKVWRFRSKTRIREYRALIREVFTPRQSVLDAGRNFIDRLNCDVVIGVHIRWGDYKTAAPALYHDAGIYRDRMLEALALFPGRRVGFIVCTEEGAEIEELAGLTCVFPKADAITDLYTLAQCNYLIASASTFSTWASYWGAIGIYTIEDRQRQIASLGDFVTNDLIVDC
ncbi:MAG: alpha-1,2-fucosyltransferase [Burkholderiales bacterium]